MIAGPVIVGAGPAGIRAAATLVKGGFRPTIIDEAPRGGGQIYRQPPPQFTRSGKALYGFEARKAAAVHDRLASLRSQIDYRPDTLVWGCEGGALDLLSGGEHRRLPYETLILATGASDRVLPFAGWLTPGVFTLGAAQIALKYQGCTVGSRTLFLGTGPLLYLVAYQYLKAGGSIAAILDTAPFAAQAAAAPTMALADPAVFAKGLYYLAILRSHGVTVRHGVRPVACLGEERVTGLEWRIGDAVHRTECDAIAFGLGLRSETQLADLAGCRFAFDRLNRAWLPVADRAGRSSVPGVYLAGDSERIRGADAAELSGERAALALLEDTGRAGDNRRARVLERRMARIGRFRTALERAFPFPEDWFAGLDGGVTVCRCEGVTLAGIRQTAEPDINRTKARTRAGMGRCQGRMCAAATAEIAALAAGSGIETIERLRGQSPAKPLPFAISEGVRCAS